MQTLAVIPARLGSTRLTRKPLRLLGGAPLIVRVYQRVRDMRVAERVVVATDSEEVLAAVRGSGGEALLTSDHHPSGTDRVAEVAQHESFKHFDAIVNIQGDEPFMPAEAVRGATDLVRSGRFPVATAAARASSDILNEPNVVKVVTGDDDRALYFSRAPVPFLRDEADRARRDACVRQHLGVYAYTRRALQTWVSLPVHALEAIERLEQLRPLAAGLSIGVSVVDAAPPGGVDTEEDLHRANQQWNALHQRRS